MSKLTRESIEKAEKLLDKKPEFIEESVKQDIEKRLARSAALALELKGLREAEKEKRLDIEENARGLARVANKAKRAVEAAEAAQKTKGKVEAKTAKRAAAAAAPKQGTQKKPAAPKGAPPETS